MVKRSRHPNLRNFLVYSLTITESLAESGSKRTASSTIQPLGFRTSRRIDQKARGTRFAIARGPLETLVWCKFPDSGKTYPGAICLGPQITALHSPTVLGDLCALGPEVGAIDSNYRLRDVQERERAIGRTRLISLASLCSRCCARCHRTAALFRSASAYGCGVTRVLQ